MKTPEISIIVPCYNQEKYIGECLDSVLAQSFENWECIVVNDGSTDNSLNIIKEYTKKSDKIKLLNQKNSRLVTARNNGIKTSSGKYIYPLDGDDKIAPDCLAKLYEAMEQQKGDVIFSLVDFFGNMNGRFELELPTKQNMIFNNKVVCSALYKKTDFEKYGGYDINMNRGLEDWEFWLNFVEDNKVFYRIDEVLFYYRRTDGSFITRIDKKTQKQLKSYIYKKHRKLFLSNIHLFIKKFLYHKKQTSSGHTIIKICKIPVFRFKKS